MADGPIFIGGLSFSGKTPLRLMLTSHPRIAITRRTYMWPRYYGRFGDLGRPQNLERCLAAMLASKHIRALEPDLERIRREFWAGEPSYARLFALFQRQYAERVGKPRWGDQLGFIERYAGPIFAAHPDARMIHMLRDPRERYAEATPRERRRPGKLGWDTARWLRSAQLAERNRRRYPDRYSLVRYESLIGRPEETLRAICAFIGEEFVPAMLSMEGALRFGPGALPAEPAPAPAALSLGEVMFTQLHARRQMLALGYRPAPAALSAGDRLRFCAVEWPANLAGMLAWRALEATPLARH